MKLNAFKITQELRNSGISTDVELADRKFKKILSFASKSGAKYVVLVGAREMEEGNVTIKDMESGDQEQISLEMVSKVLVDRINVKE
jgi:histidyl-tRNA synthetase